MVCLSYGERGESAKLWKHEGMTLETVKSERKREAENAAKALGVHDIQFFDLGDYPLEMTREAKDLLAQAFQRLLLSARSYDRIIKVARTIADLGGAGEIDGHHIAEAIQLRNDIGLNLD